MQKKYVIRYLFFFLCIGIVSSSVMYARQFCEEMSSRFDTIRSCTVPESRVEALIDCINWLRIKFTEDEVKRLRRSRSWNWEVRVVRPIKAFAASVIDKVSDRSCLVGLDRALQMLENDFRPADVASGTSCGSAVHDVTVSGKELVVGGFGKVPVSSPFRHISEGNVSSGDEKVEEEVENSEDIPSELGCGKDCLSTIPYTRGTFTIGDYVFTDEQENSIIAHIKRISEEEYSAVRGLHHDVRSMIRESNPNMLFSKSVTDLQKEVGRDIEKAGEYVKQLVAVGREDDARLMLRYMCEKAIDEVEHMLRERSEVEARVLLVERIIASIKGMYVRMIS